MILGLYMTVCFGTMASHGSTATFNFLSPSVSLQFFVVVAFFFTLSFHNLPLFTSNLFVICSL